MQASLPGLRLRSGQVAGRTIAVTVGPQRRPGRADEIGSSLCAFLCSDRAAYLTGQAIYLDGGRTQCPV